LPLQGPLSLGVRIIWNGLESGLPNIIREERPLAAKWPGRAPSPLLALDEYGLNRRV